MSTNFDNLSIEELEHRIACSEGIIKSGKCSAKSLSSNQILLQQLQGALSDRLTEGTPKEASSSISIGVCNPLGTKDKVCLSGVDFDSFLAKRYLRLKTSADNRGKCFTLTLNEFRKLLKRKNCAYLGTPLTFGEGALSDMTVDRIDSNGPYSKDNTVAVCHLANQLKNSLVEDNSKSSFVGMKNLTTLVKNLNKHGVK